MSEPAITTPSAPYPRPSLGTRVARPLYFVGGLLFVALGYVGIVVPMMPSTIFFILALWAFKRSSPKLEEWLLYRSPMGPALQDWERDKSIKPRTKKIAITMVWVTIGASVATILARGKSPVVAGMLLVMAALITWYIASRKNAVPSPSEN